ncbi:MAG: TonB family protein [Bacteroidota bacterium]|nr:TonB family protein [Bacteroidota bacterium]
MPKINLYSEEWCDMVFVDRNREYGAYFLRKFTGRRHFIATLIGVFLFVLAITGPTLIKKMLPKKKEVHLTVTTLSNIDMEKIKKKEEPQVKDIPQEAPKLKSTIKFTPPVIKPDDQVSDADLMKSQEELNQNKAAISTHTVVGSTDADAVDMADLVKTTKKVVEDTVEKPFTYVEQMPDFPGGTDALMQYLGDNIKYPTMALENDIQGTVVVRFVVNRSGKLSDVQVVRGIGGGCDEEAVRVVKGMPAWKPGKQNGQTVRVYFVLPVKFVLKSR